MFRYIFTIFLIAATPAWAGQVLTQESVDWKSAGVLDLETAKKIALSQNPSLEAAAKRVAQAKQRVAQAGAAYWPWLDITGSVANIKMSENSYDANLASARLFNPFVEIQEEQDYNSASFAATWLLFDGFDREFSRAMACHGHNVSKQARADAQRLIMSAVAQAYYGALLAREDIAIAEADASFNQRLMQDAQVRYDFGAGSLSDVLNFEIAVHGATTQLITGTRTYELALLGLGALLGIDNRDFIKIVKLAELGPESPKDMALPDINACVEAAKKNRPDVLQAGYAQKQAKAAIGAARADFFPKISLSASVNAARENDAGFEGDDLEKTVAASLSYNLFAGGLHHARLAEARAGKREATANLCNVTLNAVKEVRTSASSVRFAQEQLKLQEKTSVLVKQNRDLVEKGYQAGQESLVRLNEAQRNLIQAQSRLVASRVYLRQAWEDLHTSTAKVLE